MYACDFDLLTRLSGLRRLDVVATENLLSAGFHERLHNLLPGIEEVKVADASDPSLPPTLVVPQTDVEHRRWFTARDREEELADFARELKHRTKHSSDAHPPTLDRCAIVYQRPLPYLYLAPQVFENCGIAYQSGDALPLSVEPFAAALDLVLTFVAAEGNRASTIALLSSPHFTFRVAAADVAALDRRLREIKFSGGWERLASVSLTGRAAEALTVARSVAAELAAIQTAESAAAQLETLLKFLDKFDAASDPAAPYGDRHLRARCAVMATIESLRDAYARHDAGALTLDELTASLRRWIDSQTFTHPASESGVRLLDAATAAYADVDELRIVGLVENDWPEPATRSIFYPSSILAQLGWPADGSRAAGTRARFRDLLSLPRMRLSASAFTLEEDAVVSASPYVEELEAAGLPTERREALTSASVFLHEKILCDPENATEAVAHDTTAAWLNLRASRSESVDERGTVGPRAPETYAVSHVERYLECPFKYYAAHVLGLPEERDEEPGLTPQERGRFIHDVFEAFFNEWQRSGRQTITIENVADALAMFEQVADSKLEALPEADRALERTHLIGSAAAAGLAERAFAFEIEQGGEVVERLLEHPIEGRFAFQGRSGSRYVAIRAKADRIDLMADGTLRVIDYKLSKAPKPARALQLSIYGVCAEQALDGRRGKAWSLTRAGYVAFKEKDAFVPLSRSTELSDALREGQQRFLDAIAGIESGEFPVRPDDPFRCQWCGYSRVCRKDYVGDE